MLHCQVFDLNLLLYLYYISHQSNAVCVRGQRSLFGCYKNTPNGSGMVKMVLLTLHWITSVLASLGRRLCWW